MRYSAAILALFSGACISERAPRADSAALRDMPLFEVAIWPGEGIPVIHAVRDQLPLREAPLLSARIVGTLNTKAGQPIEYDSTRHQTIEAAPVDVIAPATVRSRDFGAIRVLSRADYYSTAVAETTFTLSPPATLQYLQHRAEETCFVRVDRHVMEANPCAVFDATKFRLQGQPRTLWWVFVSLGATIPGWLLVSQEYATVVSRRF